MAANQTTLSSAITKDSTSILVASVTGVTAGRFARIDGEIVRILSTPASATVPVQVQRGQEGSAAVAHAASAFVIAFDGPSSTNTGGDFGQAVAGAPAIAALPAARVRTITSYSASGAISLPSPGSDAVAILNGTGALAMTLANPSTAQDGDELTIIANGKAAHTVTITSGLGNGGASFDVGTFSATLAMCAKLVACGGFWVSVGPSSATAMAGSPTWA